MRKRWLVDNSWWWILEPSLAPPNSHWELQGFSLHVLFVHELRRDHILDSNACNKQTAYYTVTTNMLSMESLPTNRLEHSGFLPQRLLLTNDHLTDLRENFTLKPRENHKIFWQSNYECKGKKDFSKHSRGWRHQLRRRMHFSSQRKQLQFSSVPSQSPASPVDRLPPLKWIRTH